MQFLDSSRLNIRFLIFWTYWTLWTFEHSPIYKHFLVAASRKRPRERCPESAGDLLGGDAVQTLEQNAFLSLSCEALQEVTRYETRDYERLWKAPRDSEKLRKVSRDSEKRDSPSNLLSTSKSNESFEHLIEMIQIKAFNQVWFSLNFFRFL